MRYHTTTDGVGITCDTNGNPATLTLTDETTGHSVVIRDYQYALMKLVRRGMSDLQEVSREREERRAADIEHERQTRAL
jgi:hypothetical protein